MNQPLTSAIVSPNLNLEQLKLNKTLKLGVMASGSGSNFEAIAQAINKGELNAQVEVLIYNNPDAKVKQRADKYNIPTVLLNHRDFSSREELDQAIVDVFKEKQIEWVVMAGWMRIVTNVLLNAFPQRVINIHPSLLGGDDTRNGVASYSMYKTSSTRPALNSIGPAISIWALAPI